MSNRIGHWLKKAFVSRSIYLLVVINLCFVAYVVGQSDFVGHGVARCVAPKPVEVSACYFPPPPPLWKVVGVVLNAPPLMLSAFVSESLERSFPALCDLMPYISLSIVATGVWLQWTLVGFGIENLIKGLRRKAWRT